MQAFYNQIENQSTWAQMLAKLSLKQAKSLEKSTRAWEAWPA